ncbi:acyl-CoA dehydrogenase [Pedobacter yonginense]|uniref:Acyl-CoA dehydrogenase n=1 Tax=Pedobacter yonginense TaxID=651869 RepID=A0A317ERB9_9SPHI|nr:acyl-CoA dehydrogenase family protein [Pedobacter yonginense]PWS29450.1 acyl-CoA dehydrogenase [Pedobacter yonginense]
MIEIEQQYTSKTYLLEGLRETLKEIEAHAAASEHDPEGLKKEFQWLKKSGLLAVVLPGEPLDFNFPNMTAMLELLKEVGKANLSVGRIFEGHINTLYLIHLYASPEQRTKWYDGVRDHGHLFGVWNTQAQNGIVFLKNEEQFQIQGSKTFCSGVGIVDRALVTGNIDSEDRKGWQMSIVDMSKIGIDRVDQDSWKPLGMKASRSYTVDFSGYVIDASDFISPPGTYLTQPYFSGGAIRFAAVHLGGAEAVAEHTITYLKELGRTEDPIQRMRIAKIMMQLVSGRLWLEKAGHNYDEWSNTSGESEKLIAFANMTRVSIEDICLQIMDESNKCVGARGLMAPYQLERIFRDLTFYLRQPAPDATRLNVADFFIKQKKTYGFGI